MDIDKCFNYATLVSRILYEIFIGALQWIVPRSWYAKDVSGDVVLITGGGSGLGRAIALEYARLGSSIVLWDINEAGMRETRKLVEDEHAKRKTCDNQQIERKLCLTYRVDVSDRSDVNKWAAQVVEDLNVGAQVDEPRKYVSVLVNNAGIYHGLLLRDLKDEQIERIFKINIMSHFWTVRAFMPTMIEREKGHIVEIASMGGLGGFLKQVDYCATKFATVGFEESLSVELDYLGLASKIRTTSVCPFFFDSNLFSGFNAKAAALMSTEHVAQEAVAAMRCNHSRVLIPKFSSYVQFVLRTIFTRQAYIHYARGSGFVEGIQNIKGHATAVASGS